MTDVDVVVVGAGLAGLSCALELHRRGVGVQVLEASDGDGGRVRTDVVEGFRLDRGFQIFLTAYPEAARQLDLARLDLRAFQPGALVRVDGRFHRVGDPFRRPRDVLATVRAPVGSIGDKARIGWLRHTLLRAEPSALLRAPETTTRQRLAERGFSDTVVERLFRPWFGGVLLDPSLSTSSRMFEILFRTFSAGDAAVPATGMQAIPEQLAAHLPAGVIELRTPVDEVTAMGVRTADSRRIEGRAVVVATAGPVAARLTGVRDPGSRSSATVWFAADRAPIDEPVLLVDGEGSGPARNAAVLSAVSEQYAPPGAALVAASAAGRQRRRSGGGGADPAGRLVRSGRRRLAAPAHRRHRARLARPVAAVRPQALGATPLRHVRVRRPPRHGIDPGRDVFGSADGGADRRGARRRVTTLPARCAAAAGSPGTDGRGDPWQAPPKAQERTG